MKAIFETITKGATDVAQIYTEPLDGDETEMLSKLFLLELNKVSGNITDIEYNSRFDRIYKKMEATGAIL